MSRRLVVLLAVLAVTGGASAQTLASPETACSGASNLTECYTQYVADRLYERQAVDVGFSAFVGQAGPAVFVLLAFGTGLAMTRWR